MPKSQNIVNILIVDNEDEYIDLFKLVLDASSTKNHLYKVKTCYNYQQAIDSYKQSSPDIIIMDLNLPGGKGTDFCKEVRRSRRKKYTSIIITNTSDTPSEVVRSFNAGGDDFCSKRNAWIELPARIKSALRIKHMQESLLESNLKLRKANKQLQLLSESDELTDLRNMRYFKRRLPQEFSRAHRYDSPLSLLMFDLDFFKNINDSSNHLVGSHVLSEVGKILKETIRTHDIGARFGGDEYVAMLTQTGREGALIVAKRILEKISTSVFTLEGVEAQVTASIGVASYVPRENLFQNGLELLKAADDNLYKAKDQGRACVANEALVTKPIKDYNNPKNKKLISEPFKKTS